MSNDIKSLLKDYVKWYESRFTVNQLTKADEIITPFVNHLNDRIALYVTVLDSGKIRLSDDGVTLQELELMGFNFTKSREKLLDEIKRDFGVHQSGEVLYVVADDINQFPQRKHNLLQAVLKIYDLLFTSNSRVKNMFTEDVYDFLFDNEFGGNKADLTGASGNKYPIDYILGPTKKRPYTIIQFYNDPNFEKVAAQYYVYNDLKKSITTPRIDLKYVIIANDEKKIPNKSKIVADDIGIELIPWHDKKKILELK